MQAFEVAYGTKWPKATAKISADDDVLLEFYDYWASTGSIFEPRTRSSRPLRPCAYVNASLKD